MTRARKPRWRCALCAAFGFADTAKTAEADYYRHYNTTHRQEPVE